MLLPLAIGAAKINAITLDELYAAQGITPERFAEYFSEFKFKFHEEVQDHKVFLTSRSGDCDDYATLAADVLRRSGFTPRLIAVRMPGETHVVCYIEETKSYLDYNARKDAVKTVACSPEILDIAASVSASFGREWTATYEFTYSKRERVKRLVNQIVYKAKEKSA